MDRVGFKPGHSSGENDHGLQMKAIGSAAIPGAFGGDSAHIDPDPALVFER